jgi:general stress protein YciG
VFGYYDIKIRKSILTKVKHYGNIGISNLRRRTHTSGFLDKRVAIIKLYWWAEMESIKMAGTKAGGQKAAATNRNKYGKDFYAEIGRKGGRNGHTGGFAANPELAKIAGAKGGRISKRGKAKKNA